MTKYELLKNPDFEERYIREQNVSRRDYYSKFPRKFQLISTPLYHKKKQLTNEDIKDILTWYDNMQELKKGASFWNKRRKKKEVERKDTKIEIEKLLTLEEIKLRDSLIEKEQGFRFKVVENYYRIKY